MGLTCNQAIIVKETNTANLKEDITTDTRVRIVGNKRAYASYLAVNLTKRK